jgi:hypothetical protein
MNKTLKKQKYVFYVNQDILFDVLNNKIDYTDSKFLQKYYEKNKKLLKIKIIEIYNSGILYNSRFFINDILHRKMNYNESDFLNIPDSDSESESACDCDSDCDYESKSYSKNNSKDNSKNRNTKNRNTKSPSSKSIKISAIIDNNTYRVSLNDSLISELSYKET